MALAVVMSALLQKPSPPRLLDPCERRIALGIALTSLLVALGCAQSSDSAIFIKWLLDPLAHSTSSAGALIFLAALTLCCLMLAAAPALRWADTRYRLVLLSLGLAVMIGQAANLAGHLALMQQLELPVRVAVYYWQGTENTYSYLLHSHAGKVALTTLASWLGFGPSHFDTGIGLRHALPPWVPVLTGASLLLASMLALLALPQLALRSQGSPALIWLYGVGIFNCLKTIADGGPLTYRVLPAAFAVLWATGLLRGRAFLVALVLGLTGYGALWSGISGGEGIGACFAGAMFAALLLLPVIWTWPRRWPRTSGLIVCVLILGTGWLRDYLLGPASLWQPLPPGSVATVFDLNTLKAREFPVPGITPAEAYRQHGDDPLKPRRTFLRTPAMRLASDFPFVLRVVDGAPPAAHGALPLQVSTLGGIAGASGSALLNARVRELALPNPLADEATALSQANYFCFLHLLAANLRAEGLTEFALVPVSNASARQWLAPGMLPP